MLAHNFIFRAGGHFIIGVGAREYFGQWRAILFLALARQQSKVFKK